MEYLSTLNWKIVVTDESAEGGIGYLKCYVKHSFGLLYKRFVWRSEVSVVKPSIM